MFNRKRKREIIKLKAEVMGLEDVIRRQRETIDELNIRYSTTAERMLGPDELALTPMEIALENHENS